MKSYSSWGNYPKARQQVRKIFWRADPLPVPEDGDTLLPHGLGRSYGDSCLNDGGSLLDTTELDHFIEFDRQSGLLRAEAGVSLAAILELAIPHGWFLPVTPGTKFVTLGGAIANDVHGKNHHRSGTFGRFVKRFELLRSDGSRLVCTPTENADLFRATIGGLGLTGLVTWSEVQLRPIKSDSIDYESVQFSNLDEFFELADESDKRFEHTVAWVDCLVHGKNLGRGLFLRGNHVETAGGRLRPHAARMHTNLPVYLPGFVLNRFSIRAVNSLLYNKQRRRLARRTSHFDPFFYPLDSIGNWNRLYGRRGFMQYQCVVPLDDRRDGIRRVLSRIAHSEDASFLAVLKIFGDIPSPGLLSFPRPGVTLALDFANRGARTLALLEELDRIVRGQGGRVYPAKDARMSSESFDAYFPEWREFSRYVDPRFSSSFWRRVTGAGTTGPR